MLGLLVVPSRGGAALAFGACAAYLARRPARLALTAPDLPSRRAAATVLISACGLAAAGLLAAARVGGGRDLWPLLLCLPFGVYFTACDMRGKAREITAELAGAATFSLLPATFATLADWAAAPALSLAALMMVRSLPAVLLVRTYLRRAKGQIASAALSLLVALAGTGLVSVLAGASLVPDPALWLALLLLGRTCALLGFRRLVIGARILGWSEAVLGAVYLIALAVAYRL